MSDEAGYFLKTEGFLNFSLTTIESILKLQHIYHVSEVQVFLACVSWSNANSFEVVSRRAALKTILRWIRFLTFSSKEFTETVKPTRLLSAEDERVILRSLETGESIVPVGFSDSRNLRDTSKMTELNLHLYCPSSKRLEDHPPNTKTSFRFEVNRDILIQGVKLDGSRLNLDFFDQYEEDMSVTLREGMLGKVIRKAYFHGQVRLGAQFSIEFDRPASVYHDREYSLHVSYTQSDDPNLAYVMNVAGTKEDYRLMCLKFIMKNDCLVPPGLILVVAVKLPA